MLVNRCGLIAVEDLHIKGLARSRFAKSILDAAWGAFILILLGKAAEAARLGVKVHAPGTSQRCPCGAPVPKAFGDRWHYCETCGLSVPRDHASALCIEQLGRSCYAETWTSGSSVA
jgi:putative transposase